MSSAIHQSNNPSPCNSNNNKFHQHNFLADPSTLANPTFPPLWGIDGSYPLLGNAAQHPGEDFVVPDTGDVFSFSSSSGSTQLGGFQLPYFPEGNNSLSGGGWDGPCLSSDYLMNVSLQNYGNTCTASAYDHLTTLGKSAWQEFGNKRDETTTNGRVGRYSVEERRDRILRYLKKRNLRNFNKTIKYACRKTLADRRIRVRGRFAKNNEEVAEMKQNGGRSGLDETISPYYDYADDHLHHQMRQDGEDQWVQLEAISSLMYNYVPHWQGGLPLL